MRNTNPILYGHRWRSSKAFLITVGVVSLFSEKFLYGFIVPILKYMLEDRLGLVSTRTQKLTTGLLATHGLCSLVGAPVIAHFADKITDRKYLLLSSLVGCALGTLLVATTPSLWALFLGRVIQGFSGSATWISSFAMIMDSMKPERMGQTLALAMSFVNGGVLAGPAVSGALYQVAGYWPAWSVPFTLLGLDFFARMVMIDRRRGLTQPASSPKLTATPKVQGQGQGIGLLSPQINDHENAKYSPGQPCGERLESADGQKAPDTSPDQAKISSLRLYRVLLVVPRVLVGLVLTLGQSIIFAAFDTTLPLYLHETFHWGTLPVGMVFLGIQGPSIILGPLIGGLRDRLGLRYPTTIGWTLVVPALWLVATPGQHVFPWIPADSHGEAVTITSIVVAGFGFLLVRGAGAFQLIAVTKEIENRTPNLFGPHGANSRISAMMEVSSNAGMVIGPLISGGLSEAIGYYYMNCVMSSIAFIIAILSLIYLQG